MRIRHFLLHSSSCFIWKMDFFRPTHPLNLENSRFFLIEPFPYQIYTFWKGIKYLSMKKNIRTWSCINKSRYYHNKYYECFQINIFLQLSKYHMSRIYKKNITFSTMKNFHHWSLLNIIILKNFFVFSKERKGYQIILQAQNRTEIIDHM